MASLLSAVCRSCPTIQFTCLDSHEINFVLQQICTLWAHGQLVARNKAVFIEPSYLVLMAPSPTFVRPFIMKAPGQYVRLCLVMVVVVKTAVGLTMSALCMQSLHIDCTCAGCCWLLLICWVVSRAQPFWSLLITSERFGDMQFLF